MDRVLFSQQNNFKFNYHNCEEKFKPEGYEIPENEKISTENTTYALTDYISWYPKQPYKNIEYNPPLLREKFQLSIWKADIYGVYKIKDRYFTPKHERASAEDLKSFSLKVSLDHKSIFLVEESTSSTKNDLLVIIIDSCTLEITNEIMVKIRDNNFVSEGYDDYYDSYYDDSYSKFGTTSNIGRINVTNNGKNIVVGVTKDYKKVHYYYAVYNSETGEIENKIQRTQENKLDNVMISWMRQNIDKPDEIIIGTYKDNVIEFSSFNLISGNSTVINRNDKLKGGAPRKIDITDSGKTIQVVYYGYINESYRSIYYAYGVNEHPEIDPNSNEKKPKTYFSSYSSNTKTVGENFWVINNNDMNILEAKVFGKVSYTKATSIGGEITQYYDVKDFSLQKDNSMIWISKFTEDNFFIEVFPAEKSLPHYKHEVREITMVKFNYPVVTMVKGCNEILLYSITDDLCYYLRLYSPFAFEWSSVTSSYSVELKGLVDLGDYFTFVSMSFTTGSNPYFNGTYYKRYIEKENLPNDKLLTWFDICQTKFLSKEEDAFILHFVHWIYAIGTNTYELYQVVESDYKLGEIIHIQYTGILTWNKGGKSIAFRQNPVNFNDRSSARTVFETTDFLKVVKLKYDNATYMYKVYIWDEIKYVKTGDFKTDNNNKYQMYINNEYY